MYEELVKALRCCADDNIPCKSCPRCAQCTQDMNMKSLFPEAADAIEELSKPRWIPVTERLPEEQINPYTQDFEHVLCVTIWGDVRPFKYGTPIGHKDAHFWNGAGYVDAYITHWMPLPEPPKEET